MRQLSDRFIFGHPALDDPLHLAVASAAIGPHRRMFWARQLIWKWRNRRNPCNQNRATPGVSDLVSPLVQDAFANALFRQDIARIALGYVSARVIFHPGTPPTVQLAPQTLLLLILARPVPAEPTLPEGLAALCQVVAATKGWAGFWDQWILNLARQKSGWTLPAAALRLPMVLHGPAALAGTDDTDPDICTTSWRQSAPAYCLQIVSGLP